MDFVFTARASGSRECDYHPAEELGLRIGMTRDETESNYICTAYKVRITNTFKEDFKGVVHIRIMEDMTAPKFFMPGYMYNTNN